MLAVWSLELVVVFWGAEEGVIGKKKGGGGVQGRLLHRRLGKMVGTVVGLLGRERERESVCVYGCDRARLAAVSARFVDG